MRLGREDEARKLLTKAFEDDEFNVRVANSLKVLRHLEKYRTIQTPHFVLRYDAERDELLARYLARYLEEVYGDLARKFDYRPKGPFLVEVFNNHEMFSGRTIALPDLHTIGACTGRMVAMVSPHGKGIRKPFNWGRVLRHELVHLFNLEQTHFLVPHWLTEGLAVINEGYPRPQQWNQLLLERVPAGELMDLGTIDLGFIRPKTPLDWHMAYCQSQLYVEYTKQVAGPQAVGALLAAYAEGLGTDAAIARVCKIDRAAFEKGYRAYLDGVVRALGGKLAEKPLSFRQARDAHEKDPNNPDLAARLAEFYLKRDNRKALELANAALAKKKNHPRASYVRARLYRAGGEDDKALEVLEAAFNPKDPDPKLLQLLGRFYYESKQFAKAADIFESGRKARPYESEWLTELARVYTQTGEHDKLIQVLKDLVPTDADELDLRKRLAQLLRDAGRFAVAEKYAREALEIDVRDPDAEELLGDALLGQRKAGGGRSVSDGVGPAR
jgi:tetratricopeptide (TPR) repeat protein